MTVAKIEMTRKMEFTCHTLGKASVEPIYVDLNCKCHVELSESSWLESISVTFVL